jgi:hypothetical protein
MPIQSVHLLLRIDNLSIRTVHLLLRIDNSRDIGDSARLNLRCSIERFRD